jgi:acetyl esterase/lipase
MVGRLPVASTPTALVLCLPFGGCPVLYVGYRMQPRYPISAVADALDDYRWLPETGCGDGDIVVAGDSAAATLHS